MKKKIGNQNVLYPMPVTIVGALVNGKPNFLNIAHVGILNAAPPAPYFTRHEQSSLYKHRHPGTEDLQRKYSVA